MFEEIANIILSFSKAVAVEMYLAVVNVFSQRRSYLKMLCECFGKAPDVCYSDERRVGDFLNIHHLARSFRFCNCCSNKVL